MSVSTIFSSHACCTKVPISHQYQQLPLIPVEDFLSSQPEHSDDDEKTLMFARINHELTEREELEKARQELLKKKQSLIAENQKRKDDLASLDQDLERFIDVCSSWNRETWQTLTLSRLPNRYRRSSKRNTKVVRFWVRGLISGSALGLPNIQRDTHFANALFTHHPWLEFNTSICYRSCHENNQNGERLHCPNFIC